MHREHRDSYRVALLALLGCAGITTCFGIKQYLAPQPIHRIEESQGNGRGDYFKGVYFRDGYGKESIDLREYNNNEGVLLTTYRNADGDASVDVIVKQWKSLDGLPIRQQEFHRACDLAEHASAFAEADCILLHYQAKAKKVEKER